MQTSTSFARPRRASLGFCLLAGTWALNASFAWGQIEAPIAGFLHEPASGTLRPVIGLPGAWSMGQELTVNPAQIVRIARHGFAVIVEKKTRTRVSRRRAEASSDGEDAAKTVTVSVVRALSSAAPQTFSIPGAIEADLILLNGREDKALLVSQTSGQVQWIEGLPDHATASRTVSLPLQGALSAALNWNGDLAMVGSRDASGPLYRIPLQGEPEAIGNALATAIVFAEATSDAYIADAAQKQLLLSPGGRGLSLVATLDDTLGSAVELESAGGGRLAVVSTEGARAGCFDLARRNMTMIDLPEAASHVRPFGPDRMLSLGNVSAGHPSYILDMDESCNSTLRFIPPAADAMAGGRQQ